MEIRILHIDDEPEILKKVHSVVDGETIAGHALRVADSCGFEEGMKKLEVIDYDLVILDLCIGKATLASDKVGDVIFQQIQERVFIPVIFFTGLPEYVKTLESDIVRAVGKASGGYDELFKQIEHIINTGFIALKNEMTAILKEGVRAFFWNFVHPNEKIVGELKKDDVSLKYLLLRRLGRTLSQELTRSAANENKFDHDKGHPMEYYIYPPVDGEYETGDIVKSKKTGEVSVILTPSCDLIHRGIGKERKAERILLVHTIPLTSTPQYKSIVELKQKEVAAEKEKKQLPKEHSSQIKNAAESVKKLMGPNNERHFFLPPTPFIGPLLIDFQKKETFSYEELDQNYECFVSLDDPMSQALLAKYTRYYSRVGYRDLDTEYVLSKLISVDLMNETPSE